MQTLFAKYIESCRFVASVECMEALIAEAQQADFDLEPNPLRTIAVVVYTSTRLGNSRPLKLMAELARRYAAQATTWEDEFRLNYALVAAGEAPASCLREYFGRDGEYSYKALTRIASLAYFLRDEPLLFECLTCMRDVLNSRGRVEPDLEWELDFAEAMYSALKCGRADLITLCRTASRVGNSYYLPFVSTDVNVLHRSLNRKLADDAH